jgi:hypothetical protein
VGNVAPRPDTSSPFRRHHFPTEDRRLFQKAGSCRYNLSLSSNNGPVR